MTLYFRRIYSNVDLTLYWLTCNSVINFSAILGSALLPGVAAPAPAPAPAWGEDWWAGDQEVWRDPQNEEAEELPPDMSPIMLEPFTCYLPLRNFYEFAPFSSEIILLCISFLKHPILLGGKPCYCKRP